MALNGVEKKQLKRLMVRCLDAEGKPLPDAKQDDLAKLQKLLDKADKEAPKAPARVKRHDLSDAGQELVAAGAEYLGCENTRKGVAEYFTRPVKVDGHDDQQAVTVLDGGEPVTVGRAFGPAVLQRLTK